MSGIWDQIRDRHLAALRRILWLRPESSLEEIVDAIAALTDRNRQRALRREYGRWIGGHR
jgi:hypothetical protein